MTRRFKIGLLIIAALVLIPCFPVASFVYVHLKEGYDTADRQAATASKPAPAPVQGPAPAAADLRTADFSQNSVDAHNRTDHFVENLPAQRGGARNSSRDGAIIQGNFEVRGIIESISGTTLTRIPSASGAGGLMTVEVSVQRGAVRAYLSGINGNVITGHVFVDATPDHPGRVTGYLEDWSNSGTPEQTFLLESRGGDAQGIAYRIYRAN